MDLTMGSPTSTSTPSPPSSSSSATLQGMPNEEETGAKALTSDDLQFLLNCALRASGALTGLYPPLDRLNGMLQRITQRQVNRYGAVSSVAAAQQLLLVAKDAAYLKSTIDSSTAFYIMQEDTARTAIHEGDPGVALHAINEISCSFGGMYGKLYDFTESLEKAAGGKTKAKVTEEVKAELEVLGLQQEISIWAETVALWKSATLKPPWVAERARTRGAQRASADEVTTQGDLSETEVKSESE